MSNYFKVDVKNINKQYLNGIYQQDKYEEKPQPECTDPLYEKCGLFYKFGCDSCPKFKVKTI